MPELTGSPVQLVKVPDAGVPRAPLWNSRAPVPLSSVIAALRLALDGVVRKVWIPLAAEVSTGTLSKVSTLEALTDNGTFRVLAALRHDMASLLPNLTTPEVAGVDREA
jgi:hypothetical protein